MPRRRGRIGVLVPPELLVFDPADWPGEVLPAYADHHPEAAAVLSALSRWTSAREDFAGEDLSGWPAHRQIEDLFIEDRRTRLRVYGWVHRSFGRPPSAGVAD